MPPALEGLNAVLSGTYDMPTAVDVNWNAADADTFVVTRIPINHHVGTSTFTECTAGGATGNLHVNQPMLVPLSVATGLEFQGIQHGRYAAAETPEGCVELRFFRHEYTNF